MSEMPETIYATPRGSGTMSGVYVDIPLGDEERGEHAYIRADITLSSVDVKNLRELIYHAASVNLTSHAPEDKESQLEEILGRASAILNKIGKGGK